jgi:hypothetical protein
MRLILAPLAGDEQDRTALAAAHGSGRPFRARLAGLFARPDSEGSSREVLATVAQARRGGAHHHGRTEVELGSRLAAYLAWQGVMTQTHAIYPQDGIGAGLPAGAQELGANLLVRGGYGDSRVRQMISAASPVTCRTISSPPC